MYNPVNDEMFAVPVEILIDRFSPMYVVMLCVRIDYRRIIPVGTSWAVRIQHSL